MTDAQLGTIVTLITMVFGFGIQLYRENRNRRWDIEDRKQLAAKVETSHQEIVSKIDENTELSRVAFKEANDTNMKIARITQVFSDETSRRLDDLESRKR